MCLSSKTSTILLAFLAWASVAVSGPAQTCAPPPGFVDTPRPVIAPAEQLVAHTEGITIDRPLPVVLRAVDKPLKDTFKKTSSLPVVSGDYMLTQGEYGAPGSRHIVCLTDGSTLEEEALQNERDNRASRFRYVVWNYTSEKARPVEYGLGDFHYSDMGDGRTHITWTYSFRLKRNKFPGNLGALGRLLFRKYFLEREYAALMRGVLNAYKTDAEQRPVGSN